MKVRFLDIASITAVLILAFACALFVFSSGDGTHLIISTDIDSYTLKLNNNVTRQIISAGHTLTLVIENGEAFITDHTCPDGVCAATGKVSRAGECIVCIPAKIMIRVSGENEVLDGVAG